MASIPPADPHSFRLAILRDGVEGLAEDSRAQLKRIGEGHPDELALGFEDGYKLLGALEADGTQLSPDLLSLLSEIDVRLANMGRDAQLWTGAAILSDSRWQELRDLASAATTLLPSRDG